ncbi:MAG: U32 family peptidase [Prevotella sp.]
MREIELLAPAKNLECGKAAIDHGADAVYIGAYRFGARANAGNSIDDITNLCEYAHQYKAKVYVTLNTIVYEDEIPYMRKLIRELCDAGVDAILVQDMAVAQMIKECGDRGPAIHASTQTDNRNAKKVQWLMEQGFSRVVLARELSVKEIASIHEAVPDVEIESFVHGALCVSYSGQCYASQYCFGRSANRGECAQFCRLKFNLLDSEGNTIIHQKHLLSLKDLCLYDHIEELLEAGVSSLKIEGRLKDVSYVKNVVAAYSMRLNDIISRHPNKYKRASEGLADYDFTPNLRKSFNRGFTNYFLHGRDGSIASFETPKAIGEHVGRVKEVGNGYIIVSGTSRFSNGDGLCFINSKNELEGFRVNKAENNRLHVLHIPKGIRKGSALYRNLDQNFSRILSNKSATRKIPVSMEFGTTDNGFRLTVNNMSVSVDSEKAPAKTHQRDNIVKQLTKLGTTSFICKDITIKDNADSFFIPNSLLAELRRKTVAALTEIGQNASYDSHAAPRLHRFDKDGTTTGQEISIQDTTPSEYNKFPYLYNISNSMSRHFYKEKGLDCMGESFEKDISSKKDDVLIMQCRYCLKHELGFCIKHGGRRPYWKEPLILEMNDNKHFRLEFNCKKCTMMIFTSFVR